MRKVKHPTKGRLVISLANIVEVRRARRENQATFWNRFGVTQSGGSRYETGRDIPISTGALVMLYLTEVIDDAALAKAVRAADPGRRRKAVSRSDAG